MARTNTAPKAVPDKPANLLSVKVPGDRGTIQMRQFTSRQFVAMRRSELDDIAMIEMTVAAIVEYLPGQDPWDLPPDLMLGITTAWISAKTDDVFPPVTA